MPAKRAAATSTPPEGPAFQTILHLRVITPGGMLGPGKVELLEHVAETGSIAEAARRMEMSYNRAWLHVKAMNACFEQPLIESTRGGSSRGGAGLTAVGRRVLTLYTAMRAKAAKAVQREEAALFKLAATTARPPEAAPATPAGKRAQKGATQSSTK